MIEPLPCRCMCGIAYLQQKKTDVVFTLRTRSHAIPHMQRQGKDRKSTRLNSSHMSISYAVFCLKKKKKKNRERVIRTKLKPTYSSGTTLIQRTVAKA